MSKPHLVYFMLSWMHRLALMVIAYRYTGEETTHLRRIFTAYDVDDSGTVDVEELRNAFALHDKYSNDEIDEIFLAMVGLVGFLSCNTIS